MLIETLVDRVRDHDANARSRRGDHTVDFADADNRAVAYFQGELAARPAAVLIPIVLHGTAPSVLLTRRTGHLKAHGGQISFPGGRREREDQSPEGTALRETEEEVGLHRGYVDVVGRLDDYFTVTGFQVTPVVGLVTPPLRLQPDSFEVAEVFEVPLDFLMDPKNTLRQTMKKDGKRRRYFAIPYRDYYIWGATAGMLVNLREVLNRT